ncbi:MAG: hypothetical protein IJB70_05555 [Clostridia bacterium]|nr:hypothetical protein [Clostridia bacterium]
MYINEKKEELENLYKLARTARDTNNRRNAEKYYEKILMIDPDSWEASFYVVYFQATQIKESGFVSAATSVLNNFNNVFNLIKKNVSDINEQTLIVNEIIKKVEILSTGALKAALTVRSKAELSDIEYIESDFYSIQMTCLLLLFNCGDEIESTFCSPELKSLAANAWKKAIELHKIGMVIPSDECEVDYYSKKIGKYDEKYTKDYEINQLKTARQTLQEKIDELKNELNRIERILSYREGFINKFKWHLVNILGSFILSGIITAIITFLFMDIIRPEHNIPYIIISGVVLGLIIAIKFAINQSKETGEYCGKRHTIEKELKEEEYKLKETINSLNHLKRYS